MVQYRLAKRASNSVAGAGCLALGRFGVPPRKATEMLGRRKEHPEEERQAAPASAAASNIPPVPAPASHQRLGELLLSEKLVSPEHLQEAMDVQKEQGGFIGQILVQLGHVRQEDVASCLVKQCKIPHLSLLDYDIGTEVLNLIPRDVCERHHLIPIDKLGRILTVAMVDPLDLDALEEIRQICPDLRIKPILCNWEHFDIVCGKVFKKGADNSADAEMTAQSLGLMLGPAKQQAAQDKVSGPETANSASRWAATHKPPAPEPGHAAASHDVPEAAPVFADALPAGSDIGAAIRDSMHEAVQALLSQQTPQPGGLSPAELVESLRQSVQEAVQGLSQQHASESPAALAEAVRESMHEAMRELAQNQAGSSPADLVAAVRESMHEAVRELAQSQAGNNAGDLAAAVRESMHEAVRELAQSQAGNNAGDLVAAVRESMREAVREMVGRQSSSNGEELAAMLRGAVHEAVQEMAHELAAAQAANSPGALAETLRDSLRETVSAVAHELGEQRAAPAAPSAEELATLIRDGVGGALQESLATIFVQMRAENAQARQAIPPPDQLAAAIRDSVGGVMQETLASMMVQLRASMAQQQAAAPDMSALMQGLRDSVGAAMQESVAEAMVQMRATAPEERPQTPPLEPQQLASAIRDSVGGVMQEALAGMVVQLRAMAGSRNDGVSAQMQETLGEMVVQLRTMTELQDRGGISPQEIAAAMRESIREALLTQQHAQELQGAQLRQIAEAALQSVQQVSQLVDTQQEAQTQRSAQRRERHASVSAFGAGGAREAEVRPGEDGEVLDALESEHPIETFTFGNFCCGPANEFTAKLSQAVARHPGQEYNPFFLFGHVGIGKTHLISAIGNEILRSGANRRVGYVSASHFARRLLVAAKEDAVDAFRENYCHWDVLILDDIQFLAGRVEAQEEFFHIFNVLHHQERQIIIASDKAPDQLGLLEQRLVSRFASGIVAELKAPEWETRVEILRRQVTEARAEVPAEILSLVAMRVGKDVRKMTGSLKKIIAFSRLVQQDMSCEMANEILSHLGVGEAA